MYTELFLLPTILFLYMLPTAVTKEHNRKLPIVIINIFLGWTIIGWVYAMYLARRD